MSNLFAVLFLAAVLALTGGLIRPRWVGMPSRKRVVLIYGGAALVAFVVTGLTDDGRPLVQPAPVVAEVPPERGADKTVAAPRQADDNDPATRIKAVSHRIDKVDMQAKVGDKMGALVWIRPIDGTVSATALTLAEVAPKIAKLGVVDGDVTFFITVTMSTGESALAFKVTYDQATMARLSFDNMGVNGVFASARSIERKGAGQSMAAEYCVDPKDRIQAGRLCQ